MSLDLVEQQLQALLASVKENAQRDQDGRARTAVAHFEKYRAIAEAGLPEEARKFLPEPIREEQQPLLTWGELLVRVETTLSVVQHETWKGVAQVRLGGRRHFTDR